MIFRALDSTGDWQFGQGQSDYLRNEEAIELNVATRLKCFLNDCFWSTAFGIDWWNLLGSRSAEAQANIIVACRTMIAESYGVVKINTVTSNLDRSTRRLTLQFNIDTIFSRNVVGVVQP